MIATCEKSNAPQTDAYAKEQNQLRIFFKDKIICNKLLKEIRTRNNIKRNRRYKLTAAAGRVMLYEHYEHDAA